MAVDLNNALKISASGMKAQGTRLRVISENIANQDSVGRSQGADPYRRKTIVFKDVLDRQLGVDMAQVSKIGRDSSDFIVAYEPYHPLADDKGYVRRPNVNGLIEILLWLRPLSAKASELISIRSPIWIPLAAYHP